MADDSGVEGGPWPMPKFIFEVDFGAQLTSVVFQEVSGMDTEVQLIEYCKGSAPLSSAVKMPGIAKYRNVTMIRGIYVNDNTFWDWVSEVRRNTLKRLTVLIKLLDEKGVVTMQWQLNNALVTKIGAIDLRADGNEVMVDTLEVAYEQLTVSNGR